MAKAITVIPATKDKFTELPTASIKKRKVAAYARVSTEHEEQQTSYDAQVDYYTKKIKERTDWVFVEVYTEMLTKTKARCCTHRAFFAPKNQFLHPNAPIAKRKGYCKMIAGNCISF